MKKGVKKIINSRITACLFCFSIFAIVIPICTAIANNQPSFTVKSISVTNGDKNIVGSPGISGIEPTAFVATASGDSHNGGTPPTNFNGSIVLISPADPQPGIKIYSDGTDVGKVYGTNESVVGVYTLWVHAAYSNIDGHALDTIVLTIS